MINSTKTLILIALSLFLNTAFSQTYLVIGNKGGVTSKSMGREFQVGDVISVDEQILFRNLDDMVGLIRNDGKRFVLKNVEGKKNHSYEFKKCLVIGKTRVEWKNWILSSKEDLQEFFTDQSYIFLDSVAKIRINPKTFPQSGAQFFYFTFKWKGPNGEENIDKKLEFKRDTLLLRKKNIFSVDKKPIEQNTVSDYFLMYFNRGDLQKIGHFHVIFPDEERLIAEVRTLIDYQKKNGFTNKIIQSEVEAFIRQFYGSCDRVNINTWLEKHFGIPKVSL